MYIPRFIVLEKIKTPRSQKYMAWVRTKPCVITGDEHNIVAHHVRLGNGGGTGLKPSDFRTVPLRADVHVELHNVGEGKFWCNAAIDPDHLVLRHMMEYAAEHGLAKSAMNAMEILFVSNGMHLSKNAHVAEW